MFTRFSRQVGRAPVIIPILMIAATLVFASRPLLAATRPAPMNGSTDIFVCSPATVAAFTNRVHVSCSPADGAISYFAYCSATDSALSSRFLSVFTTAKATGKNLNIYFDPADTSGSSCGCLSGNCRVLTGAEVRP